MRGSGSGRTGDDNVVVSSQRTAGGVGADAGRTTTRQQHDDADNQAEESSNQPAATPTSSAHTQSHQAQASDREPSGVERAPAPMKQAAGIHRAGHGGDTKRGAAAPISRKCDGGWVETGSGGCNHRRRCCLTRSDGTAIPFRGDGGTKLDLDLRRIASVNGVRVRLSDLYGEVNDTRLLRDRALQRTIIRAGSAGDSDG